MAKLSRRAAVSSSSSSSSLSSTTAAAAATAAKTAANSKTPTTQTAAENAASTSNTYTPASTILSSDDVYSVIKIKNKRTTLDNASKVWDSHLISNNNIDLLRGNYTPTATDTAGAAAAATTKTVASGGTAVAAATAAAAKDAATAAATTTTTTGATPLATPTTHYIEHAGAATPYTPRQHNLTEAEQIAAERARIREEFYATYDVMTGIRIAATLGGFFGLMVFLIVWKSRSSSNETLKVLKDPKMAAVAAVCMQEEEEREIHEAMVATGMSIYPDEYDEIVYRRQRMLSLGNVSAPPLINRGYRFSSIGGGGYSSLLAPPRRYSYSAISAGGGSLGTAMSGSAAGGIGICGGSGSVGVCHHSGSDSSRIFSNYPMGAGNFGTDDYFVETEDELGNDEYLEREQDLDELDEDAVHKRSYSVKSKQEFLAVPHMGQDSRRSSAMTCCSTDSSYLERRCSAYTLGLSNLPTTLQQKLTTASRTSSIENWDYYYPDIQVIQPTPKASPCPSERSIYKQLKPGTPPTTSKTALTQRRKSAARQGSIAAGGGGGGASTSAAAAAAGICAPKFVRKHSIVSYDPESAQAGRKQQIHSISADTVDVYPYNQHILDAGKAVDMLYDLPKPIQSAPPISKQQTFSFTDSPTDELRLGVSRKIALVELQHMPHVEHANATTKLHYENSKPNSANDATTTTNATAIAGTKTITTTTTTVAAGTSSSISIDSTPMSMDKLNGSASLGTISGKALFNVEKRAPLASLSSFKISSLEYQDSDMRSLGGDSVFLGSAADTDEDMQQLSSDSEELSLDNAAAGTRQHDGMFTRENTILRAPITTALIGGTTQIAGSSMIDMRMPQSQSKSPSQPQQQATRHAIEKRFSLCNSALYSGITGARPRRPLLQRHSTISASSNDRISLIEQPMKEFQSNIAALAGMAGAVSAAGVAVATPTVPLETHFGAVICTNSPPTHSRRAQLLQQYSDPHSLPTTTTTTTTTNTEDDTCSTLNTELVVAENASGGIGGGCGGSGGGGGGGESTTHTQYSSLNTVISLERCSPLTDNNNLAYSSASASSMPGQMAYAELPDTSNQLRQKQLLQQQQQEQQQQLEQQLPVTRLADDPCASSVSDTVISRHHSSICMPASLKNLILRSNNNDKTKISKSATNLSQIDATEMDVFSVHQMPITQTPAVVLEMPLIKLPTEESSDSATNYATIACDDDANDADDNDDVVKRNSRSKSKRKHNETQRDPSLPGSSRKWSKETLF